MCNVAGIFVQGHVKCMYPSASGYIINCKEFI